MILGIDTSCYTTSAALVDRNGQLLAEARLMLPVKTGERGLRQSDGLFLHVKQLPQIIEQVFSQIGAEREGLLAVAASTCPRPVAGSYLPVFLGGTTVARSIAASAGCPFYPFSHQEGHIQAALSSANRQWHEPFLALHLSGGTGEILLVTPKKVGFQVKLVGDTDLPPGQFIDRVGVALGLPFPAGPALEKLAGATKGEFRLSGAVKGTHISFSGPESAAQRGIAQGVPAQEIAAAVLDNISKSLEKAVRTAMQETGCAHCIAAGGVAANLRIRHRLQTLGVDFALPSYAGDNAYGIALLGAASYRQEHQ